MFTPRKSARALGELAWDMIEEAFAPIDPHIAQFEMPVERFVEIIAPLKPRFTHHPRAKALIRDLLEELRCDPEQTYFDVPKLRIVTHGGYLTAGVGYAYKKHRDIWYACPPCQINWWTPITEIEERCGLVIHPAYFDQPVKNNSNQFDAYQWNADGRKNAATYIHEDPRPHPHLQEERQLDRQVIVGQPGSLILFSAQHLHATIPNDSGRTRFSIDFRTVNRDDVLNHIGAKVIDSSATGTTLRDFLRASDHETFEPEVVATYETGGAPAGGVLVFNPNAQ
ncbi:MAG: hypothetical protein WCE62_07935 [Polyangiales bacterium]